MSQQSSVPKSIPTLHFVCLTTSHCYITAPTPMVAIESNSSDPDIAIGGGVLSGNAYMCPVHVYYSGSLYYHPYKQGTATIKITTSSRSDSGSLVMQGTTTTYTVPFQYVPYAPALSSLCASIWGVQPYCSAGTILTVASGTTIVTAALEKHPVQRVISLSTCFLDDYFNSRYLYYCGITLPQGVMSTFCFGVGIQYGAAGQYSLFYPLYLNRTCQKGYAMISRIPADARYGTLCVSEQRKHRYLTDNNIYLYSQVQLAWIQDKYSCLIGLTSTSQKSWTFSLTRKAVYPQVSPGSGLDSSTSIILTLVDKDTYWVAHITKKIEGGQILVDEDYDTAPAYPTLYTSSGQYRVPPLTGWSKLRIQSLSHPLYVQGHGLFTFCGYKDTILHTSVWHRQARSGNSSGSQVLDNTDQILQRTWIQGTRYAQTINGIQVKTTVPKVAIPYRPPRPNDLAVTYAPLHTPIPISQGVTHGYYSNRVSVVAKVPSADTPGKYNHVTGHTGTQWCVDMRYYISPTATHTVRVPSFRRRQVASLVTATTRDIEQVETTWTSAKEETQIQCTIPSTTITMYPVTEYNQQYMDIINACNTTAFPVIGYHGAAFRQDVQGKRHTTGKYKSWEGEEYGWKESQDDKTEQINPDGTYASIRAIQPLSQVILDSQGRKVCSMFLAMVKGQIKLGTRVNTTIILEQPIAYSNAVPGQNAGPTVKWSTTTEVKRRSQGYYLDIGGNDSLHYRSSLLYMGNRVWLWAGSFGIGTTCEISLFGGFWSGTITGVPIIKCSCFAGYKLYIIGYDQHFQSKVLQLQLETEAQLMAYVKQLEKLDASSCGYKIYTDTNVTGTITYEAL